MFTNKLDQYVFMNLSGWKSDSSHQKVRGLTAAVFITYVYIYIYIYIYDIYTYSLL